MTQDNIILAILIALVGVIGTGVGILASLIPIELTAKRDYYQRNVKMWILLDFEQKALVKHCNDDANRLKDTGTPSSKVISSLPLMAWQTVRSNGEFIAAAPPELLNAFNVSYREVDELNATISHYMIFTAILPDTDNTIRIRNFHAIINSKYITLSTHFQSFKTQIDEQITRLEKKAKSAQKRIDILKWIAGVAFVGAFIALIVLLVLLFISHL